MISVLVARPSAFFRSTPLTLVVSGIHGQLPRRLNLLVSSTSHCHFAQRFMAPSAHGCSPTMRSSKARSTISNISSSTYYSSGSSTTTSSSGRSDVTNGSKHQNARRTLNEMIYKIENIREANGEECPEKPTSKGFRTPQVGRFSYHFVNRS